MSSGAAVAYSRTSHRFLVVWPNANYSIQGRFVGADGLAQGVAFPITNPGGSLYPGVAWNPATDEFGVLLGVNASGASAVRARATERVAFVRHVVRRQSDRHLRDRHRGQSTNSHYVMAWSLASGSNYAELDSAGTLLSSGLISGFVGGSTSVSLGTTARRHLPIRRANAGDGGTPSELLIVGAELNSTGFPITGKTFLTSAGGRLGSYYPRVTTQAGAPRWNVVYSLEFARR